MLSFGSFSRMLAGEPVDFAVKYTVGNVLSICATAFLVGPARQLRNMTASTRLAASCIYIGSLLLTVVLCFVFPIAPLIIISIIVQWGALSWYCLSYIPYARRAARGLFNSIVDV
uniref:Vesicle transport protein n=1 Tax=Chromera velia CCMP2878 TaxID=1169474 RepID=A0A0G4I8A4_9ALVE|eukprot:Cvel_11885.t1-p1 / transcript=Cvel_11885.t1 / gene=Cvel_11885 / organism=Chromera_velia_CCMP2878 / gene_product=Vesicle transport protein SFT2B, putative / transcript_product=Vesicle transport protein SFT2B, putative / location=Cvel_scaffold759:64923-68874(-) / protein_length=114 / sequence_SO=supercontig / SO=protein_coding / is_pseudo=false